MRHYISDRARYSLAAILLVLAFIAGPVGPTETFAAALAQADAYQLLATDLVSNSQFVLGPQAQAFRVEAYLQEIGSPLADDADMIQNWCGYASINPQVVLALLQLDDEQVTRGWKASLPPEERDAATSVLVLGLAERFYRHLYEYGERAPTYAGRRAEPLVRLADGSQIPISTAASSATYAILDTLAPALTAERFTALADPTDPGGFAGVWRQLFPQFDALDASVSITPDAVPPADLLQFPFPIGQTWWFNGAHNWNGSGATYGKPFSSMDFFTAADSCSAPPSGDWAVAAAAGQGYHPSGSSCWYRIDHTGGWTTSYYHLRNAVANGQLAANGQIGTIACETCAGGFATGPHVHFSLLYNGAYVDLEGVKLSGWTMHSGNGDYNTGSLERNGVYLQPYSSVRNEGIPRILTATPTVTATPARTATPAPSRTPTPFPSTAKYLYPKSNDVLRTCPVTLVAELNAPGASEVHFMKSQGGSVVEVGGDASGTDGWQAEWDCQDTPDGSATLSLNVFDANGRQILQQTGQTAVTLSKKCNEGTYRTAFFSNAALSGPPTSSWCKASGVSYNWGTGSPGAGVTGSDYFSARFRGNWRFGGGAYRFQIQSDDGVRIWIDRVLVLNEWHAKTPTGSFEFTQALASGLHEIWLEYYEATGYAAVTLSWTRTGGGAGDERQPVFLPLIAR